MQTVWTDTGSYTTCTTAGGTVYSLRTKISDGYPLKADLGTLAVEFDGKKYTVGESAIHSKYQTPKTSLPHKLAVLSSLAVLNIGECNLVIGCPLSQFINPVARSEFAKYFTGDFSILVNGKLHNIHISAVKVLPETIGAVLRYPDVFTNALVGVVDIGGLNTNACVYDNGKPLKHTIITINEGGNIIDNKIKHTLAVATGCNYRDYEIPYLRKSSDSLVQKILSDHLATIINELRAANWNIDKLKLFFTGGGSETLRSQITATLPNAVISDDPFLDNLKGYKEAYPA